MTGTAPTTMTTTTRTDLRSLEVLLAVAEHGSIGAAARALDMRQPSVTDRLQRLEQHLHLDLVRRTARGSVLTSEGVAVTDWAREVVAASDRLESGVAALRARHDSQLRVSASLTIAEYLVPRWLAELARTSPETSVALRMGNSAQVAENVLNGDADIGFVETSKIPAGLHTRTFAHDELVAVVGPDHPWRRRRSRPGPSELATASLIVREEGSGTRIILERALAGAGHPHGAARLELASTAAIKAAVLAGQGVGVLSGLAVADDVASGRLYPVPIDGIDLRRRLRIVWRAGTKLVGPAAGLASCALRTP